MPPLSVFKRTIRLIRQKEKGAPASPKTLSETIILDGFTTKFDRKPFLLFNIDPGENIILILSNLCQKGITTYADGTFPTSPSLFYQIYTAHGIQSSHVFPSIFALLPNKTEIIYVNFFHSSKNLNELFIF